MTTPPRTTVLSIVLVTVLVSACVVAGAGMAEAAPLPRSVPMTAVFDGLEVGDSASKSWVVDIPKPALITGTAIHRDGDVSAFRWRASLCPVAAGSCVDLLKTPDGAQLAAGIYRLGLGVTMVALGTGQSQSIEGRLTFVERPTGSLAYTGSNPVSFLLCAVAAVAIGLLLFLAARRRRPADETEDLS